MFPAKQKVIQKRARRKERFARMARIKHRMLKNVFTAQVEVLPGLEKFHDDDSTLVHQYSPGIILTESNGTIDIEPSVLNKSYISNGINVMDEGDIKLVQLKLCKSTTQATIPSAEELESLEKRGHSDWANKFRKFSGTYNDFLTKHEEKFTSGKVDKESKRRYQTYQEKKKEFMATKNCAEVITCFNQAEDYISEVCCNSRCLASLGYSIEDFVDMILNEGIPRVHIAGDTTVVFGNMMDNFEYLFENTLEFSLQKEFVIMGKKQQVRAGNINIFITGYFVKNRAELSYLLVNDDLRPLPLYKRLLNTLNLPIIKKKAQDESEKIDFLKRYYNDKAGRRICGIKEINIISLEDEISSKLEEGDVKTKSEHVSDKSLKLEYSLNHNQYGEGKNRNQYIMYSAETQSYCDTLDNFKQEENIQSSYTQMLQFYMLHNQNSEFNYVNY